MDMAITTAEESFTGADYMSVEVDDRTEATSVTGVRARVMGNLPTPHHNHDGKRQKCRNQAHCNGGRSG